jgi:phytoene/squalene synthetase
VIGLQMLPVLGTVVPVAEAEEPAAALGVAFQLTNFLRDVGEDLDRGRIYLPGEDLERFGVTEADLAAPASSPAVRRLLAFETARARALLVAGAPIIGTLRGWARLAVAGYVAGGLAAADALAHPGADPLAATPAASKARTARHAVAVLARGRAA